jgi:GlpG protein
MRTIGTIEDGDRAQRFGDYLLTRGIRNLVEEGRDGWIVWVRDEDKLDDARGELDSFLLDPDDARYAGSSGDAESIRREGRKAEARRRKNIITPRDEWIARTASLLSGRRKMGRLALLLIIASIAATIVTNRGAIGPITNALLIDPVTPQGLPLYAGRFHAILGGQLWRLVTPIFLHFGFMHIIFNMLWLRHFGSMIEGAKGTLRFAVLVVVSAVLSNVAQYLWSGPFGGGMSGVLYSLFGYAWLKSRFAPGEGLFMDRRTVSIMIFWLFFCMTGWVGPIGNVAHGSGLLIGMAWAWVPHRLGR